MGGSKACKGKEKEIKKVVIEYDFYNRDNWKTDDDATPNLSKEIIIKSVQKKNVVTVKVGDADIEMFTDRGSQGTIVPSHMYKKEIFVVVVVVSSPYLTKLAYVDVGSSRVHDSPRVIQPFLNYVVILVPDRRLT